MLLENRLRCFFVQPEAKADSAVFAYLIEALTKQVMLACFFEEILAFSKQKGTHLHQLLLVSWYFPQSLLLLLEFQPY